MATAMSAVPIWSASLSLVPKSATARSFSEAAKLSITRLPMASSTDEPRGSASATDQRATARRFS